MIELTSKAIQEIKRLKETDAKAAGGALRVRVIGGGCSGMSYKLEFESSPPAKDDKIIETDGVTVYIDPKSMLFLKGMTLDFTDGLSGKGFVFNNPNAKRTCGCGESFSV